MTKDPIVYLKHIIESIELVQKSIKGFDKASFNDNPLVQDAVIRRLQLIGESARKMPDSIKEDYSNIPWQAMVGMRNILVHDYLGLDLDII